MKLIAGIILFLAGTLALQAAPSAPKPRPLLLLSPFTGEKLVIRANAASVQATILSVEAENGRKSGWDRTALIATLPWYADAELLSRGVNLPALLDAYDRAVRAHPEFRAALAVETARVRSIIVALDKDRQEKLAAVFSFRYDLAAPYTWEELRQRIRAAETAAAIAPEEQANIDRVIAPLREHLANLEAGRVLVENQWRTPEEARTIRAQAAESARLSAYSATLQIPMDAQIIGAARMQAIFATVGIAAGACVAWGIVLLFRRRLLPGAGLILLPVLGAGYYAALFTAKEVAWPVVSDPSRAVAGSVAMTKIIESITKTSSSPDAQPLHVRETDVNDFLAAHLALHGSPATGALNLQRVGVKFTNDTALVCETAEWRGHPLRIQHVYHIQNADGSIVVTDAGVRIGNAPVPDPVKEWLRVGLNQAMTGFFAAHDPLARHTLTPVTDGALDLLPNAVPPRPEQAHPGPSH